MEEKFMLRDVLNIKAVEKLSNNIFEIYENFDKNNFSNDIKLELDSLNFGDRSKLICKNLKKYLPNDYEIAVNILIKTLKDEIPSNEIPKLSGFIIMPLCLFVSTYGLDYYDLSIKALYEMTKRFTAEGDIRPFIIKYPEKTIDILLKWTKDKNTHVRRLSSEGTRPRLPLGIRLPLFQKDPMPIINILDKLKNDEELYVRRSVANNLNDISKDNPDIVTKTLKEWNKIEDENIKWLIKHSLRTLIKQGNKEALDILGYDFKTNILVENIELDSNKISIGDKLNFNFKIKSNANENQNLMIDYTIYYMKANGKNKPKVFKLAKKNIKPSETIKISKNHSFKPINTRKHYKGIHYLEIKINGENYFMEKFVLE
ncbi:MAG: DNA alkylation repair protein [Cyanobacteriota bacterium]